MAKLSSSHIPVSRAESVTTPFIIFPSVKNMTPNGICLASMTWKKRPEMEMKTGKEFMKRKLKRKQRSLLNKDGFIMGNYKCF